MSFIPPGYIPQKITSIVRPESPITEALRRHSIQAASHPAANINDVWESTGKLAVDSQRNIPTQQEIQEANADHFSRVFPGGPNLSTAPIISDPPQFFAPKPQRTSTFSDKDRLETIANSSQGDFEGFASSSQQSVQSAGPASSSQAGRQRDSSPLKAFRAFSKTNRNLQGVEAVNAFNVSRNQQGKSVLTGTDQSSASKRHRTSRAKTNTGSQARHNRRQQEALQRAKENSAAGRRWLDATGRSHRPRQGPITAYQFRRQTESVRNSPEPS